MIKSLTFTIAVCLIAGGSLAQTGNNSKNRKHNIILFVADGLRAISVNPEVAPALAGIRDQGVNFVNSHALMPTMTTANASAIATGHYLGDTGDFGNTLYFGFELAKSFGGLVPYIENNTVIDQVNKVLAKSYLNEQTIVQCARLGGYNTAVVGKSGVAYIFDQKLNAWRGVVVDDLTGRPNGEPLPADISKLASKAGIPLSAPSRGKNALAGNFQTPGTLSPNTEQSAYFNEFITKVLLPKFKDDGKPFLLVYWSRDPDATEHGQGDSFNTLEPGINGPTSVAAVKNADNSLKSIQNALAQLGLDQATDIIVTSDHGFSTISKQSKTSYSASQIYSDVVPGFLPPGFLAIDMAHALDRPLHDAYRDSSIITAGRHPSMTPALTAGAWIGDDEKHPDIIVAPNGGMALLYFRNSNPGALAEKVTNFLMTQDYVGGVVLNDSLGKLPGTLPMSSLNLMGSTIVSTPSLIVSFRSYALEGQDGLKFPILVSDVGLQQGQGMHGDFSRADTYNFMAATGPDFKKGFTDPAPVSNADLAVTIAALLKLDLPKSGKLTGRVIEESLATSRSMPTYKHFMIEGTPAANGLVMRLKGWRVGDVVYFDAAGYPERTIGIK